MANKCDRHAFTMRLTPNGKRESISLGNIDSKEADIAQNHIKRLRDSKNANTAPHKSTTEWVDGIGDKLHRRLAELGLVAPRYIEPPPAPPPEPEPEPVLTLKDFFTDFVDAREKLVVSGRLEEATVDGARYDCAALMEFLGEGKPLADVTTQDAQNFRDHLLSEMRPARKARTLEGTPERAREIEGKMYPRYSEASVCRRLRRCREIFERAVEGDLIGKNPFRSKINLSMANPERQHTVKAAVIDKVLAICPTAEWRLLIVLSRYGGLRVPSEPPKLRWRDIDFDNGIMRITSVKTKRHKGKGSRLVPIFPEIMPHLLAVRAEAVAKCGKTTPPPADYVLSRQGYTGANLRTMLGRYVERVGEARWERCWHNMRATRQSELERMVGIHTACRIIGNSAAIAARHYLDGDHAEHLRELFNPDGRLVAKNGDVAHSLPPASSRPVQAGSDRALAWPKVETRTPEYAGNAEKNSVLSNSRVHHSRERKQGRHNGTTP